MQKTEEIVESAKSSMYFVEEGEGNEHNHKLLQSLSVLIPPAKTTIFISRLLYCFLQNSSDSLNRYLQSC